MAHKTLIGGTAYEIGGGKTLINGTGYSNDKGKTLVGGTGYELGFKNFVLWKDCGQVEGSESKDSIYANVFPELYPTRYATNITEEEYNVFTDFCTTMVIDGVEYAIIRDDEYSDVSHKYSDVDVKCGLLCVKFLGSYKIVFFFETPGQHSVQLGYYE